MNLPDGRKGAYAFKIAARAGGTYAVQREECEVFPIRGGSEPVWFAVENGHLQSSESIPLPRASTDRLHLSLMSGVREFRAVHDGLAHMSFYNLSVDRMRELQPPETGSLLARDGSNVASVLKRMARSQKAATRHVHEYLETFIPGFHGVEAVALGPRMTFALRQAVGPHATEHQFLAESLSDGTLRAIGILVALFQARVSSRSRLPLVGIEEPEAALHPAAAGVLRDALSDASATVQVLVTSHSPDLLDSKDVAPESLLAVTADNGVTRLGPIDAVGRQILRDRLFTAGELLRQRQLIPIAPSGKTSPLFRRTAA